MLFSPLPLILLEGLCTCSWHGLWLALLCAFLLGGETALSDWRLSANPKRKSSLPSVGQNSVCLSCGDVRVLVFWVRVSSRATCEVVDLPSQSLMFSLLVCDLQVMGMCVPGTGYQPAPRDLVAWSEGANLQFSQPKSLQVGREPSVTHIGAVLHPCRAPKPPPCRGCGGSWAGREQMPLAERLPCSASPQLSLKILPQPVPSSTLGSCTESLVAISFSLNTVFSNFFTWLLDAVFSSLGLDALLPPV